MEKEKTPEPVDAKSTVATTITAPKEISPLPKKTGKFCNRLNSKKIKCKNQIDSIQHKISRLIYYNLTTSWTI